MLIIKVSLVWVVIIIITKVGDKNKGKDDDKKDMGKDDPPDDSDDEVTLLFN